MQQQQIEEVARVLPRWNPPGPSAQNVPDLDGYRTEAIDIIAVLRLPRGSGNEEQVVMNVLNQAFDLSLEASECVEPAKKVMAILTNKKRAEVIVSKPLTQRSRGTRELS